MAEAAVLLRHSAQSFLAAFGTYFRVGTWRACTSSSEGKPAADGAVPSCAQASDGAVAARAEGWHEGHAEPKRELTQGGGVKIVISFR